MKHDWKKTNVLLLKTFIQYLAMVHSGVVHVALCHVMRKKLLVVIGAFKKKKKKLELWLSALLKALSFSHYAITKAVGTDRQQLCAT